MSQKSSLSSTGLNDPSSKKISRSGSRSGSDVPAGNSGLSPAGSTTSSASGSGNRSNADSGEYANYKKPSLEYFPADQPHYMIDTDVLRVACTKCDFRRQDIPAQSDWIKVVLSISGKKSLKICLNGEPTYSGSVERWGTIIVPTDVTESVQSTESRAVKLFVNAGKLSQLIRGFSDSDATHEISPRFNVVDPVIRELVTEILIDPEALLNNSIYVDSLAHSVYSRVLRTTMPVGDSKNIRCERKIPPQLKKVVDYIHSEYATDIRLDTLVEISQLSHHCLSQHFQAYYETSPYKYLVSVRMQEARHLLLNTTRSIDEIRRDTGHNSLQWFSTAFKNEFGVSPMNFRNLRK